MKERFGIPEMVFDDYLFLRRKNTWRILRMSAHLAKAGHLKVEAAGIKGFHLIGEFIKPSTRVIQMFGRHAVKARVELGGEEMCRLAGGGEIPADPDMGNGYVILCLRGGAPPGIGPDNQANAQSPDSQGGIAVFSSAVLDDKAFQGQKDAGGYCRSDYTRHIGAHGVHQEHVSRIGLHAHFLADPCGHGDR